MFQTAQLLRASVIAAASLLSGPTLAQDNYISAAIIIEHSQLAPGQSTRLALQFIPKPGWHVYWTNPGDAGMPPEVEWEMPKGVAISPLQHPAPHAMGGGGVMSYVHERSVALLSTLTLAKTSDTADTLHFKAHIRWLACSEMMCVPENTVITFSLPISGAASLPAKAPLFDHFARQLPRPLLSTGRLRLVSGTLEIALKTPALDPRNIRLFPLEQVFDASAPQTIRQDDGTLTIQVPYKGSLPNTLSGVLTTGTGSPSYSFHARAAF